jgi:ABC-type lipoprotein release transport system permease subunit
MTSVLLKAELLRNVSRKGFAVLFIVLSVSFYISFNTLIEAYQQATVKPFQDIGVHIVVQKQADNTAGRGGTVKMNGVRFPFSYEPFTKDEIDSVKNAEYISETGSSLLLWDMSQGKFRTVTGVDFKSSIGAGQIKQWISSGRIPASRNEVVLEKHFAKFYNLKEGDVFKIADKDFTISGRIEIKEGSQLAASNAYILLETAQELISIPDAVNILYLKLSGNDKLADVRRNILQSVPASSIASSDSFLESTGSMILIAKKCQRYFRLSLL